MMRNFTLILALVLISGWSIAQRAATPHFEESCSLQPAVEHLTVSEYKAFKNLLTVGDSIWGETFTGAMPAGWTVYDTTLNNFVFQYSTIGPSGAYTGTWPTPTAGIGSSTGSTGFLMLPADYYNTTSSGTMVNPPVTMNTWIQSPAIDCSTQNSVMLMFQESFRYCCNSTTTLLQVGVSNDGTTWKYFDVRKGKSANKNSDNPEYVRLNITPYAANQATVYLRFWMSGGSHYFWMLDDVEFVVAPFNDLELKKTYTSAISDFGTAGTGFDGFYSRIPLNQFYGIYYAGDVYNFGNDQQTNVQLQVDVSDGSASVFSGSADTIQLDRDSTAFLEFADLFVPTGVGDYTASYSVTQTQVDEVPENNTVTNVPFSVVDYRVWSRDVRRTNTVSPKNYVNGTDGDFVGVVYHTNVEDTVNSISVYISNNTTTGTTIVGQVYKYIGGTDPWVIVIETEEFVIDSMALGTWVTLPLIPINPGDEILPAYVDYCAGIEFYFQSSTNVINLGCDDQLFHLFQYASQIRLGTGWGWFSKVPQIRLNLTGATLPPVFTTLAPGKVTVGTTFTYNCVVNDPSGLPLTFDFVDNNNTWATLTDNGNGTCTVSGPLPASLEVGDSFSLGITVTNGSTSSEQNFTVKVVEPGAFSGIVMDEPFGLYPNPANNYLNMENGAGSVVNIYDMLGSRVLTVQPNYDLYQIPVSGLANGTYLVSILKDNQVYSKKITINR